MPKPAPTFRKVICVTVGTGYSREESKAIVEDLLLPATQPEHVFTMRWQPHDFVVWCAGIAYDVP